MVDTDPSAGSSSVVSSVLAVRPASGNRVMSMKSLKPPKLCSARVQVPSVLGGIVREAGLQSTAKSLRLEKFAPTALSETGVPVPSLMLTQTPPPTLLRVQSAESTVKSKLWAATDVRTLYVAVKRRPSPVTVEPVLAAAKCRTPGPSCEAQTLPWTRVPSRHSNSIVAEPPSTLPVISAPAAWRTVLSVEIEMSKPISGSEPAMLTATESVEPDEAKRVGEPGQPGVPAA